MTIFSDIFYNRYISALEHSKNQVVMNPDLFFDTKKRFLGPCFLVMVTFARGCHGKVHEAVFPLRSRFLWSKPSVTREI